MALVQREEGRSGAGRPRPVIAGLFRMWLGLAQMTGALMAGVLLVATGLSTATIFAASLTSALTIFSLVLYRGRPHKGPP